MGGGGVVGIPIYPKRGTKMPQVFPNIPEIERDVVYVISKISCKQNKCTEYPNFSKNTVWPVIRASQWG